MAGRRNRSPAGCGWSGIRSLSAMRRSTSSPIHRTARQAAASPLTLNAKRAETRTRAPVPSTVILREKAGSRIASRIHTAAIAGSLLAAMLLWGLSLPLSDASRMTDLGLVSILPPYFYLSLALLAGGFAWLVVRNPAARALPGLYLAGLIVVLQATPPLIYGTLRYSWAWKHLGMVDYIQRHGTVDPTAPFLAAYHNWPGLFFATAWVADLFGTGPVGIASVVQFTPVVLNLALVPALLWLLGRFSDDRRLLLTAAWFFVAGNWIGQDYFSPQGVTFLFYVVLLGLFLGPLRDRGYAVLLGQPHFLRWFTAKPPTNAPLPGTPSRLAFALLHGLALVLILADRRDASAYRGTRLDAGA